MSINQVFQQRIGYLGDLMPLLSRICSDYKIGNYLTHSIIPMGYEDLNLIIETDSHRYFVKIFAKSREDKDCQRLIDIILATGHAEVDQPEIYPFNKDKFLYKKEINGIPIRLCVMQHIKGKTFFELEVKPSIEEAELIIENAARINSINLKPSFVYDSWAIINFLNEYGQKKQYLKDVEKIIMDKLADELSSLSIQDLPYCFVHGDLIKTNIMRDNLGSIYILDYSVANYYPRIQELAVLFCDFLFDKDSLSDFNKMFDFIINEYQRSQKLKEIELKTLPLFIKLAHAMHVLCATYEKEVKNNQTKENEYFLNIGRIGLLYTTKHWQY
ncbi:MAG: phosphotransferase [Candidatus Levybacteria bacterium]|nr:phosphotransferase [Candidatus Levybacteria bacterium]